MWRTFSLPFLSLSPLLSFFLSFLLFLSFYSPLLPPSVSPRRLYSTVIVLWVSGETVGADKNLSQIFHVKISCIFESKKY